MPSDRPKIVIYTNESIIEKLDNIAAGANRSRGNMCETIIKEFIDQYEQEHGEICVNRA